MATQKPTLKVIGTETPEDIGHVTDTPETQPEAQMKIDQITNEAKEALKELKRQVETSVPERRAA